MNLPSNGWCVAILIALSIVATPRSALAQPTKDSHWGVSASFSPQWTSSEKFQELLLMEGDQLAGKEFTVGVVRGSTLGGEWGVSFVRKTFDDMTITDTQQDCFGTDCFSSTTTTTLRSVYFKGVEFHAAIPFVTIKQRVQLGIVAGGGIAVP